MELKRRLSLVVAIMSVAFGSGHLVQNVLVKPAKISVGATKSLPMDITLVAAGADAVVPPANSNAAQTSTTSFAVVPEKEAISIFTAPNFAEQSPEFMAVASDSYELAGNKCPVTVELTVEPQAMIGVSIATLCHPNSRLVLQHAGLSVTGKTNGLGKLNVVLPALSKDAVVSVRFHDGHTVESTIAVPEAATTRRFGVQWLDQDAFQLNAFENGASYGEIGHISAAYPNGPLVGQTQHGGFLSVLGDDGVDQPMLAEVYTYPADAGAAVQIVIEAAITKSTCAREILGETLADAGGNVTITDLVLTMPDCDAVGDILVLKNLDPDLKIAFVN